MQIQVSSLDKKYKIVKKTEGLKGSLQSFFSREYKMVEAVKDIQFNIEEGERVGFIGPNGAGKTTTIKMLTGLIYPTNGFISILGHSPHRRKNEFKRSISLVMGNKFQLWWDLPPIESFHLHRKIYDIDLREFRETLEELTTLLNVKHLMNVPVRNLSLGERMKMELVTSLLHKPKILFLDEPTIGLDFEAQKAIRGFLKEYNRKYKTTIIMTSHYIQDIEAVCDRLIMINSGKIVFDGYKNELYDKYLNDVRINFTATLPVDIKLLSKICTSVNKSGDQYNIQVKKDNYLSIIKDLIETGNMVDLRVDEIPLDFMIQECFSMEGA